MTDARRVLVVDDESDIRLIVGLNVELASMHRFDPALSALAEEVFPGETIDLFASASLPKLQT